MENSRNENSKLKSKKLCTIDEKSGRGKNEGVKEGGRQLELFHKKISEKK
jgi:hypothetical protein